MSAAAWFAVPWLAIVLAGQGPARDAAALARALAIDDPKDVVLAANEARALGDKALIVPLQRALGAWANAPTQEGRLARLFVLDALVSLKARLPSAELLPLLDDEVTAVPVFVLLARESKQNEPELLELFRRDWPLAKQTGGQLELRTWAIGNLLFAQRTPGFATCVFESLDLDLHVRVKSKGRGAHRDEPRAPRRVTSAPWLPEFPPTPIYSLVLLKQPLGKRSEELASGAIPIGFTRGEQAPPRRGLVVVSIVNDEPIAGDGLPWLSALAGVATLPARHLDIDFTDRDEYVRSISKARRTLDDFRAAVLSGLVAANVMSEPDAARMQKSTVAVIADERLDTSKPLPEIPASR